MNFRPTKWKVIVGLALSIGLGIYLAFSIYCIGYCVISFISRLKQFLIGFIPTFLIIYIIWSLFEPKKIKTIKKKELPKDKKRVRK